MAIDPICPSPAAQNPVFRGVQALWWYPEQRLYYNLGVPKGSKGEADINVGYAEALKELALKKGAEIAQAAA